MDSDRYCREIESYLCRRNAGHLVRLVGPAFEMVVGWVRAGIPLRVACAGIDRYFERHDAKTGHSTPSKRRPVRVEFCEADVLDAFDQWRRAVGLGTAGGVVRAEDESAEAGAASGGGHQSLRAHLDRAATRLTDRLAGGSLPAALETHVEGLLDELGRARDRAKSLRGEARQQLIARLRQLDAELIEAVHAATDAALLAAVGSEADADLAEFRGRMAAGDYARARDAAVRSLLRDRCRLPVIAY